MRTINLADDILAILTQSARAIPDFFLDYDNIEVELTADAGIFEIVSVLGEDEVLVIGQITLDEDLNAIFEVFED